VRHPFITANSEDRGFDCIGRRFLPYLNREQGDKREGAIHPKIASPSASLRWAVTAASHAQLVTMVLTWKTSVSMIPMFQKSHVDSDADKT
jgi:hypothetical protein